MLPKQGCRTPDTAEMNVDLGGMIIIRGKPINSKVNQLQCHFVYNGCHVTSHGTEPRFRDFDDYARCQQLQCRLNHGYLSASPGGPINNYEQQLVLRNGVINTEWQTLGFIDHSLCIRKVSHCHNVISGRYSNELSSVNEFHERKRASSFLLQCIVSILCLLTWICD